MAKEKDGGRIEVEDGLLSAGFVQLPILLARDPNLTAGAKLVYVALLWYHWRGQDYPGQRQMAEDFGFSERSARTYLHELEREGYLESRRPGLQQVNTYILRSLRPAKFAGQERQLLPFPQEEQDSVLILTESEAPGETAVHNTQVNTTGSDSDLEQTIRETATALGCPREAKQLTTLAHAESWPPEVILSAGRVVREAMGNGSEIRKPGAYLTTAIRVMLADRRQAVEVGDRKAGERRQAAMSYGRQVYMAPVIGGNWLQVEAILRESYGTELAAEVVGELQRR